MIDDDAQADELIRAAEDPAQRADLELVVRRLAELNSDAAHAALERWADGADLALADAAFRHLGGIPIPGWAERMLVRFASTPGHARRYESMLLLNALSRTRPLFESALRDPDTQIRSAAYAGYAIHGELAHLERLADGLDDPAPEVREYVISLWLEVLAGSDVDRRPPLLERAWPPDARPAFEALRRRLRERLERMPEPRDPEVQAQRSRAIELMKNGGAS